MQTNFKIFLLHKNFLFWSTVYVLMVTRFSYFGFTYSPVLDDNNLFGIFHLRLPHVWQDIILHYKTYMIRPVVQSLIDPMVIAPLWQNPFLVLCLITGLHLLSCIILQNILRQVHVRFEAFAIVIFALAPFSSEGTYWIAASSRIIIGLFVCVLSVYLLMRAIKHQNNKLLCIAMLCNLVAMGFYEQIICFNAFFTFVILFLNIKDIQKKWIVLLPFLNLAIILAYYAYFIMHNPQLARNEVRTIDYFTQADLVWQSIIYYFHTKQSFAFQNALQVNHILFSNVKYWCYALWTAGLGVLLVWKSNKDVLVHTRTTRAIIMGLSLCVVPLLPFFVLNYYYLANRNIFLSLLGLSIIGQALFDLLIKKQWLKNGILACLVLLLVLLNISEVACYKELNAVDRHICSQILAQVGEQNIRPENTLLVLNTRATYIDIKSNASIANASSCDWGLLGLMQVMLNRVTSMSIVCAPHGSPFVYDPNKAYTAIVGIDHENNVLPLILKQNAHNKNVIVTSKNGAYFGQLMYVSETQYVYITKGDS